MAKLFEPKKSKRGARTKKRLPKNMDVASWVQTAKTRTQQPKTLVQFFRESPFVGVELDLERQND
jgi:hypothetical protein